VLIFIVLFGAVPHLSNGRFTMKNAVLILVLAAFAMGVLVGYGFDQKRDIDCANPVSKSEVKHG
jgi:hypothetical protein